MGEKNKSVQNYEKAVISDSWQNATTSIGMENKDKRVAAQAVYVRFNQQQLEETHACDDLFARLVELPVEEMFREGFEVVVEGDQDTNQKVQDYFEEHNITSKLIEGFEFARQYGGGAMYLGADDGQLEEPLEPLKEDSIKTIDYMTMLHKFEACGTDPDGDVTSKNFGLPMKYRLQPDVTGVNSTVGNNKSAHGTEVHHSRIIRFEGERVSRKIFVQNEYWGESVLTRTNNAIRNFNISHDALAVVLQHFNQGVFKIKDLNHIIAAGNENLLEQRLAMISTMRSVLRSVVISDDEEFSQNAVSLTGIKDALDKINQRLTVASGMPHTILLGESPSGLGATGESEKRDWYDKVARMQTKKVQPVLERLLKIIFLTKDGPTGGKEPANWSIKFKPLFQEPPEKMATTRKTIAETDKMNIEMGIYTPEEARQSRYGDDEFSMDIKLDPNADLAPPTPTEAALFDEVAILKKIVLKDIKIDESDHSHHDLDGKTIGAAFETKPGFHTHFGSDATWSEAKDGPGHTHTEVKTGERTTEPFEVDPGPVLDE